MLTIKSHGTDPWGDPVTYELTYKGETLTFDPIVGHISNRDLADKILSVHGYEATGNTYNTYSGLNRLIGEGRFNN